MTTKIKKALSEPSSRLRGPIVRGLNSDEDSRVERTGGDRGAGLIRGASIIAEGEALGHEAWVDATFLSQVSEKINETGESGVKARFTHPSLSGDGLGTMFARAKNASVSEGRVIADLHMTEAGHKTPDGDLAAYVMELAEQDGDSFGVSISFMRDIGSEKKFAAEHSDEKGQFQSPDETNKGNYRHFRLSELIATDVVDEPAANPDGLFTRASQRIAHEGADLAAFALGLTNDPPELTMFDIDPTRIRDFAMRYLAEHNLSIIDNSNKENEMDPVLIDLTEGDQLNPEILETEVNSEVDVDSVVQEALANERQRISELTALGNKFNFNADAEKFIGDGKSVEEFRAHILNKSPDDWKASLAVKNPSQQTSESDEDNKETQEALAKIKERRKAAFK